MKLIRSIRPRWPRLTAATFLMVAVTSWASRPLASGEMVAALLASRADELWASGHFAESEAMARRVLASDQTQALGHLVLARSLAARLALDDAVVEAERAVADDPLDPAPHDLLAEVFTRLGRVEEASAALSRYLHLLPASARHMRAVVRKAELRVLRQLSERAVAAGEAPAIFSCDEAAEVVLPIELHDGRPFVRGRINGGAEHLFLVDTGADRTVINADTAVVLNLETIVEGNDTGSLVLAGIDRLSLGPLELRHVPALVRTTAPLPSPSAGLALSPLALGLSMTIDYERQELHLGQLLREEPADIVVPMWFPGLPMIRGEVEGNRYMFIVDTGAMMLSVDAPIARDLLQPPARQLPLRVRDAWGRLDPDAALMVPGPDLSFGGLAFSQSPIGIRNLGMISQSLGYRVGGLIGAQVLKGYRVTFDLVRRQLRLSHRSDVERYPRTN